uniref:Sesquiterpene synthase 6 n=1 Tax=Valeriana officinalis TaxID=19953 RepID=L0HP57_VALOF|nr:sesquiterpene synthase 6 [Valeriana officinalis]
MAISTPLSTENQTIVRRDANYHPSIWKDEYLQSIPTQFQGDTYKARADRLKEEVRNLVNIGDDDVLSKLELIDTLERLGIYYHFEDEIHNILQNIHNHGYMDKNQDLYTTSLKFIYLRQHGFDVPQDIFKTFMDDQGKFKGELSKDINAMLYLYEASYLSTPKDDIMDEARDFSTKYLKEYAEKNNDNNEFLKKLVIHSLQLPLRWKVVSLEARWFIDMYENKQDMNPTLLQFAKLDYNILQAIHLEDLKYTSRWWKSTSLVEKLSFARDRLVENYIWSLGVTFEPHLQYSRRVNTKVNALITVIDDVYDVYGTLDELNLFTDIVERWDVNAIDELPEYMKICFLTLFNSVNDMGYDALKNHNLNIIHYLRNTWVVLCKAYLKESIWYNNGYIPTLDEYLENACNSIADPTMLIHAYASYSNPLTTEAFEYLETNPNIVRFSSMILRLSDDLGTSSDELKRGDNPKSIQCYMHEKGVSEEKAREYISLFSE